MFILKAKLHLCLLYFIFIHSIQTNTTLAQPDFLYYACKNAANYTRNSVYQRNLNTTLATLPATDNGFGFYNLTTGQGNDTVHSVALCRGDVNPDVCRSCLNDSIVKLGQLCPNQKKAIGYYNYCLMKYSNEVILGSTRVEFYTYLSTFQNSTDIDGFNGALGPLLRELRLAAAAGSSLRKFDSGSTTGPGFSTIYGLVQCTPDLSEQQCSDCLEDVINQILRLMNGRIGGRVLLPMCNVRYESNRFFNQTARLAPPSPPPPPVLRPSPPVPPPPPSGKKNNTIRTVVIIISIVTVTVTILIASVCIFMRLKRKRQTAPPPPSEGLQIKLYIVI